MQLIIVLKKMLIVPTADFKQSGNKIINFGL